MNQQYRIIQINLVKTSKPGALERGLQKIYVDSVKRHISVNPKILKYKITRVQHVQNSFT